MNPSGQQYGRLTILMPSDKGEHYVMARCACGDLWEGWKYSLLSGRTQSCGCNQGHPKHGKSATPEYKAWTAMLQRCTNPRHAEYPRYGGRGISVHPAWREYAAFLDDVGERPKGHTLDRIDTNGNYEPGNVRWATPTEQSRNTRRNRWITINGETLLFSDWCKRSGVRSSHAYRRIKTYGWSLERALTVPSRGDRNA